MSNSFITSSFQFFRLFRRPAVANERKICPLNWTDEWSWDWVASWVDRWVNACGPVAARSIGTVNWDGRREERMVIMNRQIAIRGEDDGSLDTVREPLDFRLLQTFQMTVGGRSRPLGPEQEQRLLVALLDARGVPVTRGRLMEVIWDDQPEDVQGALNHLVLGLRRRLTAAGHSGLLAGGNGTYQLDISPEQVDVHRFHALTARARELVGDDKQEVLLLEEAMALHRGEPLAGVRGRWIGGYRHRLTEERHAVELALYEAAIRHGESRERIPGLHSLLQERPSDEWVAWLYMHALYRAGRTSDALEIWHAVSKHLDKTIAADSRKALTDLYQRILRNDDDLLRPEAVGFPAGGVGGNGGIGTRVRALGRPDPRVEQDREHEDLEDGADPTGADADDAPSAGQQHGRPDAAGARASMVFNERVIMPGGVIGVQVNNRYGS
jgi:DNA-binding SARP family transcriptional activator